MPEPPIHQCPPLGSGTMPCCGRAPFEVPHERMAAKAENVTCGGCEVCGYRECRC